MDLLAYFRVLKRRWVLILVATVAGAALGAATTLLDSDSTSKTYYKATHSLLWDNTTAGQGQAVISLTQMPIFATSGDVPVNVAKALGSSAPGRSLAEHITTNANTVTETLDSPRWQPRRRRQSTSPTPSPRSSPPTSTSATRTSSPSSATRCRPRRTHSTGGEGAPGPGSGLRTATSIEAQAINRQITATLNRYYDTFNQLQNLNLNGPPTSGLTTLESAQSIPIGAGEYETRLSLGQLGNNNITNDGNNGAGAAAVTASAGGSSGFKSPVSRGVLGALLGFLVGIGLAFLAERVDRKIRTHIEAEAAFGLPVLAEVPQFTHGRNRDADLVAVTSPLSRVAEAYRAIRTSVLFQRASVSTDELFEPGQAGPLVLMVTSASPREGKTTTSANLAAVFAEAGSSVLVVNCDFRRPTIHRLST